MITVSVSVKDTAEKAMTAFLSACTGADAERCNEVGARAAVNAARTYHDTFNKSGGWKGARYLGPGPEGPGKFGAEVAAGWEFLETRKDGATIGNDASYYAFKVTGGTITPKRAQKLTIPLVPEAVGRRAADYEIFTGRKLFIPKGHNALFELIDKATGEVRPVYALRDIVTHQPWPGAVPPDDVIGDAYLAKWLDEATAIVEAAT